MVCNPSFISRFSSEHKIGISVNPDTFLEYLQLFKCYCKNWIIPDFKIFVSLYNIVKGRAQNVIIDSLESIITVGRKNRSAGFNHRILSPETAINHGIHIETNCESENFLKNEKFGEDSFATFELEDRRDGRFMHLYIKNLGKSGLETEVEFRVTSEKAVPYAYCTSYRKFESMSKDTIASIKEVIFYIY
jgi:hypothetical protein